MKHKTYEGRDFVSQVQVFRGRLVAPVKLEKFGGNSPLPGDVQVHLQSRLVLHVGKGVELAPSGVAGCGDGSVRRAAHPASRQRMPL